MISETLLALLLFASHVSAHYSFTIHNNLNAANSAGAVHTWLSIDGSGEDVKYFSFTASTAATALGLQRAVGESATVKNLIELKTTEEYTQEILDQQYWRMSHAMDRFYVSFNGSSPLFKLSPKGNHTYNEVTACHRILRSGGVRILEGVGDPIAVSAKLKAKKSFLSRCLSLSFLSFLAPLLGMPLSCLLN